jgi:hypothetical protein
MEDTDMSDEDLDYERFFVRRAEEELNESFSRVAELVRDMGLDERDAMMIFRAGWLSRAIFDVKMQVKWMKMIRGVNDESTGE